jgi:hypothetical protein
MLHCSLGCWAAGRWGRKALTRFLRTLVRTWQPFQAIEPVDALSIHQPAFASQEHMDPAVAIAHPCTGQIPDPHPQGGLIRSSTPIAIGRPIPPNDATSPSLTDRKAGPNEVDQTSLLGRLYSFFLMTSRAHMLVEAQIGDQLLELLILVFQLA